MTIRETLNKILWDPRENITHYNLTFIHRGAPKDTKTIQCRLIVDVDASGFTYTSEDKGKIFIPFHRVLEIRNVKTGQPLELRHFRSEP